MSSSPYGPSSPFEESQLDQMEVELLRRQSKRHQNDDYHQHMQEEFDTQIGGMYSGASDEFAIDRAILRSHGVVVSPSARISSPSNPSAVALTGSTSPSGSASSSSTGTAHTPSPAPEPNPTVLRLVALVEVANRNERVESNQDASALSTTYAEMYSTLAIAQSETTHTSLELSEARLDALVSMQQGTERMIHFAREAIMPVEGLPVSSSSVSLPPSLDPC
ncbi:hypothetical protein BDY24DRAFT_419486 [Mrakia frigida]|uniref:uncharacterized protein n=1 Tax=Mrakia frigida TaxID=29902 RepID=UPI003FCBF13B